MKHIVFFVLGLLILIVNGCDQPAKTPNQYGTLHNTLPQIPGTNEKYPLPQIEGVDIEYLQTLTH